MTDLQSKKSIQIICKQNFPMIQKVQDMINLIKVGLRITKINPKGIKWKKMSQH